MHWQEMLDIKIGGVEFWSSECGKRFANTWYESASDKRLAQPIHWDEEKKALVGDQACYTELLEVAKLETATPIYVASDMTDLVVNSAKAFEPEPFLPTDLIVDNGVALLEKPIIVNDKNGRPVDFNLICWCPINSESGRAISLSLYAPLESIADDDYYDDRPYEERQKTLQEVKKTGWHWPFILTYMTPWPFGKTPDDLIDKSDLTFTDTSSFHELWTTIQVFFRIMQQRITTIETRTPDRPARRRAKRQNMETEVTVITLRQAKPRKDTEGIGEKANYSHRFPVRGHWRNQWYSSIQQHRQIWIDPFIKGPEDKPLRIDKDKIYEWVR